MPAPPGTFRIALIADTHVIGPEYTEPSESPGIDNDSILKTPDRLREVVRRLNAIEPQPERVFILGDVVHDTLVMDEVADCSSAESGYSRTRDILADLEMPVHLVWGNHDYEVHCEAREGDRTPEFTHQVFADVLDEVPYQATEDKGWRFLLANSKLSDGLPTLAMAHSMMLVTENEEARGTRCPACAPCSRSTTT